MKNSAGEKTVPLNIRMLPPLLARLTRTAENLGVSRPEAVRAAVLAWLDREDVKSARKSVAATPPPNVVHLLKSTIRDAHVAPSSWCGVFAGWENIPGYVATDPDVVTCDQCLAAWRQHEERRAAAAASSSSGR